MMSAVPCAIWIDNFSNLLSVGVPSVSRSFYRDTLWTVSGIMSVKGNCEVNLFRSDTPPSPFAMPISLISAESVSFITTRFVSLVLNESWFRYDISDCKMEDRIPIGSRVRWGATRFRPREVISGNPASNIGLSRIFHRFIEEHGCGRFYRPLVVDINLYSRLMKVCLF